MSQAQPHRFASELVKSRFLVDSSATVDLLLMMVIEKHGPVGIDRLQIVTLLDRPQIRQVVQKLVTDGDVTTDAANNHSITPRGMARGRFLFVDYFHELKKMEQMLVDELAQRFRKLTEQGIRSVALYPVGETAEVAAQALAQAGIKVALAVDDAHSTWGRDFHGVEVQPPEELKHARIDAVILATCVFQEQLRKQLTALGIAVPIVDF